MKDLYTKYVYVIDLKTSQVINTTNTLAEMQKRLKKKPTYYGEDVSNFLYVQANITSPLLQLNTNELSGYYLIQNALISGVVSGVSAKAVMDALEAHNFVRQIQFDFEEQKA